MPLEKILKPLAEVLKKKDVKVVFMLGAGISTGEGARIPDFRSPKTGLYSNLAKLNLPYAEAVFDIEYFRDDPTAFYTLADELHPGLGKFRPTKFHFLLKLFEMKGVVKRIYTQNIDTLERIAGVDPELIVEAHGSFAANHCIDCQEEMSEEMLKADMADKSKEGIPTCRKCGGYVKPDIVFFGEGLPKRFYDLWDEDSKDIDVAIVAGTSLTVYPFASLPEDVGDDSIRLLINNELVGDFASYGRDADIVALEECDKVAGVLAELCGWGEELNELVEEGIRKFKSEQESEKDEKKEEESVVDLETKLAQLNVKETLDEEEGKSKKEDENSEEETNKK